MSGRWFSLGTPVSPSKKPDYHDIAELSLKVALNTLNQPNLIMCDHVIVTLISTHWILVTVPRPQPTQRMSTLQNRRQMMPSRLVVVRVQNKNPEHAQ
jgi:hypothetical protein